MRKDFWTGSNRLSNDEETYGSAGVGGAIATGLGLFGQGIGSAISGASQGTALCGAKPVCMSFSKDSACAQRKQAFQDCVSQSLNVAQAQAVAQWESQKSKAEADKRRNRMLIIVTSIVVVALITVAVIVTRRKRKG